MREKPFLISFLSAYKAERLPALSEKSANIRMFAGWRATVDHITDFQLSAKSVAVAELGFQL